MPEQRLARGLHAARQVPKCGPLTLFYVDLTFKNVLREHILLKAHFFSKVISNRY